MSQQYHYYYRGEQQPLDLNTGYAYLLLDGIESQDALQRLVGDARVTTFALYHPVQFLEPLGKPHLTTRYWAELQFPNELDEAAYLQQLKNLKQKVGIAYVGPYFSKGSEEKIGLSDLFLVKLKDAADLEKLQAMASANGVEIVGQNRYLRLWYTLAVTPTANGNALDLANRFFESGQFAACEPDLMVDESDCVSDTYFADQWGLENTGTWGGAIDPDINACDGWANWTTGDGGTIIAVLDHGFEMNHPDLVANVYGTGYDTESGTTPAQVLGSHGTACAGIVAAEQNNSLGVSGVAPDCAIMSISNSLAGTPASRQARADGIIWAYTNGAAVISNSWGSSVAYTVIDDAITDALALGRGGLGTVIVFATGNNNGAVSYPANSNDEIIAVGAMSPCGERKNPSSCEGENWWGSNYGTELDVVAPGVKIPTTDRQSTNGYNTASGTAGDYFLTFNGTSSATPHVAGLAGLLISMNPCLTQRQVTDIIERTAQKIGSYTYSTTMGRDNGTWNNEMGYGLMDLDAAMRMTRELYIQNVTLTTTEVFQVHGNIYAGNNVDPSQPAGDVNINAGADVTFRASSGITLAPGFNVNLGAAFTAEIISTSCSDWNTSARVANPHLASTTETAAVSPATLAAKAAHDHFAVVPSPFHDRLTVRYDLATASKVEAILLNAHGQMVKQLVPTAERQAGHHEHTVELGDGLPAGLYFVRVEVNGTIQTHKLLKM